MRNAIETASATIVDSLGRRRPKEETIVPEIRRYLRRRLGTETFTARSGATASLPLAITSRLDHLADFLADGSVDLLLAFPSAPTVIALAASDIHRIRDRLLAYAGPDSATPELVLNDPATGGPAFRLGDISLAVLGAIDGWLDRDQDRQRLTLRPDSPLSRVTVLLTDDGSPTSATLTPYLE